MVEDFVNGWRALVKSLGISNDGVGDSSIYWRL